MSVNLRPVLMSVLTVLVGIEALGVTAYSVWYATQFFVARVEALGGALFLLALFLLCAVWLWALTIGLIRMRTWTRSGTLVWQTIQVVIGVGMINAEGYWFFVALGMMVLGLVAGGIMFTPSVVAVTARNRD